MKRGCISAVLAVLCLVATCTTAYGLPLQAVNPQWNEEKQQVKAPQWNMTQEEIAQALTEKVETLTDYDFLYVGHGEDSLYGADWNLSEQVGAWGYGTGTAQFQLTNPAKQGSIYTTYCADIDTTSKTGWWYKVENLEDAAYYARADAADHIRAIALTGYWGAASGTGSLAAVKDALCAAIDGGTLRTMTKEDVAALTEGEALTATQMAIWEYGNPYEVITLGANTLDVGSPHWDYCDRVLKEQYGMTAEEIDAALGRIDALAYYLMGLSMTAAEAGETTILADDAVVEEMRLVVGRQVDGSGETPRYEVDLEFSLKATPQKGDDLIVQVLAADGEVLKEGRITPEETAGVLLPDSEGKYTLEGLTLAAGEHVGCRLKLTGAQYLSRGVYVYTSEVRDEVSSQTFVGIAEGTKQVSAQQTVDLSFTPPPQEEIVPSTPTDPPVPPVNPEPPVKPAPPVNPEPPIPDDSVTVTSPKTGDDAWLWGLLLTLSVSSTAAIGTTRRKKET